MKVTAALFTDGIDYHFIVAEKMRYIKSAMPQLWDTCSSYHINVVYCINLSKIIPYNIFSSLMIL